VGPSKVARAWPETDTFELDLAPPGEANDVTYRLAGSSAKNGERVQEVIVRETIDVSVRVKDTTVRWRFEVLNMTHEDVLVRIDLIRALDTATAEPHTRFDGPTSGTIKGGSRTVRSIDTPRIQRTLQG
jgi:hypothetical protein